jgi:tRNA threonylcarbamoyladenosine biosynthesis protein TsaB
MNGVDREYNIADCRLSGIAGSAIELVIILALDTSAAAGSAAIARDGAVLVERAGDGSRTHGERLPAELMTLLADAKLELREVDRFAVSIGPGSFTGLRVGIATIQGLAMARRALVTPISSFEALAWHARGSADAIATWIDARRGEVFASLFDGDGRTILAAPSSLTPDATIDAWTAALASRTRVRWMGDGAQRYRDVIAGRAGARATIDEAVPTLAGAIGAIASAEPERGVRPHALVPLYVRRSDAELARDRREAAPRS